MISFTWTSYPSSPQIAGANLSVGYTIYNSGTAGTVDVFLRRNGSVATYKSHTIGAGAYVTSSQSTTMLTVDTTLSLASSNGGSSSQLIELLTYVNTTLSLSLSPSTVRAGQTVSASGTLSRADGGSTSGQSIAIKLGGSTVANATTGSGGSYSTSFSAPSSAGTYTYQATYAGSLVSQSLIYEESADLVVSELGDSTSLVGLGVVALIVYFLLKKK